MSLLVGLALLALQESVQIVAPPGSGRLGLAVIEYDDRRTTVINCPDEFCLMERNGAEMIDHRAGIRPPARITVRGMAGAMYRGRVRKLAILEETLSGYWFSQWETTWTGNRACIPQSVVGHYQIVVANRRIEPDGSICLRI